MAKIRPYVSQENASGLPGGRRATAADFGAPVALNGLGDAAEKTAAIAEAKENRDAMFQVKRDMGVVRAQWLEQFAKETETAEAGAPGFSDKLLKSYDDAMQKMVSERSLSEGAMSALVLDQQDFRNQLAAKAIGFEAESRAAKKKNDVLDYQTTASRLVFQDPAALPVELQRAEEFISTLGLPANKREEYLDSVRNNMAVNSVRGLVERGMLDAAEETMKSGSAAKYISGDQAAVLTNSIQVEKRRIEAEAKRAATEAKMEARSTVSLYLQDTLTSIEMTGKDPGLLTPAVIKQAFPEHPEQAAKIVGQINSAKNYYSTKQAVAFTSPAEDVAIAAKLKGEIAGVNAVQSTQQYQDYIRAVAEKRKALAEDPYGYVIASSPSLQAKSAEAVNDPNMFRQVMVEADNLQAQLGVPVWRRTYMAKAAAADTVKKLQSVGAEQAANELETMYQQYGADRWPNVVRQLSAADMRPEYKKLAFLSGTGDAVLRVNLASAVQNAEQVKKAVPETERKDIDSLVLSNLEPLRTTLAPLGGAGISAYVDDENAVKALAYLYRSQGLSNKEAATKAATQLVTGRNDFVDTYRTPTGMGGTVERAADVALQALKAEDMQPAGGGDPNVSEEYRQRAALDAAQRGTWVNTPNGDGIFLLNQNGVPVRRKDGSIIELKFKALPDTPSTAVRDPYDRLRQGQIRDELRAREAMDLQP